jgi:hypothetical protein
MKSVIELHIEEIVLHGFPSLDGRHIREVVQQQLTNLLARNGLPPSFSRDSSVTRLDGRVFQSAPGAGTGDIGTRIARNVYDSLAGPSPPTQGGISMNHMNKGGNQP